MRSSRLYLFIAVTSLSVAWLAAACNPASPTPPHSTQADRSQSIARRGMTHLFRDGLALSHDGQTLAIAAPNDAVSSIWIVDLKQRTRIRVSHSSHRIKVMDPAFSPSGSALALVATPPNYQGVASIWIVPMGGNGPSRRVTPEGSLAHYRLPQFSPNGRKLIYFKEVDPPPMAGVPPDPELTVAEAYALFELDLSSLLEVRLAEQAFAIPGYVNYRNDNEFLFDAAIGLEKVTRADGVEYWRLPKDNFIPQSGESGRGYALRRGAEMRRHPSLFFPAQGELRDANFVSFARPDHYLFRPGTSGTGGCYLSALLWRQNSIRSVSPCMPLAPNLLALSGNGDFMAALYHRGNASRPDSGGYVLLLSELLGPRSEQIVLEDFRMAKDVLFGED